MSKVNRNYKASLFAHLFGDPREELKLYNAFSADQYPPGTPVVDLTLTDVLYMDRVNDLSFSVGDKLVIFFECQSTINANMALRYLLYCGRVYEKLIDNSAMYAGKRLVIPTPEFYVLYNGKEPYPEKKGYRLSESYAQPAGSKPALELAVTVYNVNPGFNKGIVKRSESLEGYVTFVAKTREYEQKGIRRSKAVKKAIQYCIGAGILAEYLKDHGSEVTNMLLQEWKLEDARAVWEKEAEERSDRKWAPVVAGMAAEIEDKDAEIADMGAEIASKDAEIALLRALLSSQNSE